MRACLVWFALVLTLAPGCSDSGSSAGDTAPRGDGALDAAPREGAPPRADGAIADGEGDGAAGDAPPAGDSAAPSKDCVPAGNALRVGSGQTYATIKAALAAAVAGDTIVVADGTYELAAGDLVIAKGGSGAGARLTICAEHSRKATLRAQGRVVAIRAPWVTLQGFVIDGKFGTQDVVSVDDSADELVLRDLEVHSGQRDGIDMGGGSSAGLKNVLVEGCVIHHMLNGSTTNQQDAHCIVATDFDGLTIRDTEAYYCSGDSVQVGTDRDPWDNLVIERCRMWTGPLPAAAAGFAAGESPGENALDTKAMPHAGVKGRITLRDSAFWGFDAPTAYIANRAALNLKDQITGVVERCTVRDSEIGLRIRGGSGPRGGVDGLVIKNVVMFRNRFHVRVEDGALGVELLHDTFGRLVDDSGAPQAAGNPEDMLKGGGGGNQGAGWRTANNLFVATGLPSRAAGSGDRAAPATSPLLRDVNNDDYHLLIDANAPSAVGVAVDRDGRARSATTPDVGAYER
ncbi:MAG: hypothetical protein KC503_36595 [Myxococcales bacterium]|nr:hypothetical protein [Myxococcales bacterium]